jgi:XRE family aerobic/anaerobic benzoate catabolism transcriptional regulator
MTLRELAEASGLSQRFVSQLEAGEANIAIGRLASVAKALDVSLADLVSEEEERPKRVAMLGLRGAGKSTIGPRLAQALRVPFVELDEKIEEAAGLGLAEIFALHGEAYYRRLEERCLAALLADDGGSVIALPGGIVSSEEAFGLAKRHCTTVWLKAKPEDHMRRVLAQGDRRPMANRPNAMAELRAILAAREPLYAQADITVDTSRHDRDQAVRAILAALK